MESARGAVGEPGPESRETAAESEPASRPDHVAGAPTAPRQEAGAGAASAAKVGAACDYVPHLGDIVIRPDGTVVFFNATEEMVRIAHALDPENPDVLERLARIERLAKERSRAAPDGGPAGPRA